MKRWSIPSAILLFLVGPSATAFAQAQFTGYLTGTQEVPVVVTPAQGTACFTLTSLGLEFFVTVEGLSGPITAAHLHRGAPGVSGPPVRTITAEFAGTSTARGLWKSTDAEPLTAALIQDLFAGDLYVNVHTGVNPGGEIRGQVQLSAGAHLTANLYGTQENLPLAVGGKGTGSFTLTEEGLQYKITVNGLTGAIADAHIHTGAIGVNGGVTFPIAPSFAGRTAAGFIALTPAQRKDLLAGNMYVNVHTAVNAGGEIRGQINLAGGFGFSAALNGAAETPAVATAAQGSASATLTPSGLRIDLSATGLSGLITGAHLHNAPVGTPGGVVRDIGADFFAGTTTASVLWRYDDAQRLTPALVSELLLGNIYVNLHTAANPAGEIRGQLVLNNPAATNGTTFTATLTGSQEEPPTAATARGTGTFRYTPAGLEFRVTVNGLTGAITAAHFHSAAIGVAGGVVRGIAAGEFIGPNTLAGTWTPADASPLTAALVTELFKGNLYINFHTAAFPGGEIRGQIFPASGAELEARLTDAQEVTPPGVGATGTGSFTLTPQGLLFNFTLDGLTGAITAGHIHGGARGVNGGVVRAFTLGTEVIGTTGAGVWKPTDASPLTATLMTNLLLGNVYVNFHTAAHPVGELRGQVVLSGGEGRGALLTGSDVVPPVTTPGKGVASMTLTDQGLVFGISAANLLGALVTADFHNAFIGSNGPSVRTITPEFTARTGRGVWKSSDASPLTPALLGEAVQNEIYVDLHTTAEAGGEVRGQAGVRAALGVIEPGAQVAPDLRLMLAPNPIQGSGTISFFLSQRSDLDLGVYDIRGAQVARLDHGVREPGWHHVAFDAHGLANGIYFLHLQGGPSSANRKLLVLH